MEPRQIGELNRWSEPALVPQSSVSGLLALMHDTRNLVASILLYCDLIDELGVPSPSAHPYAGELRLIANASQQLLAAMTAIAGQPCEASQAGFAEQPPYPVRRLRLSTGLQQVESLAGEVKANQSLLAALAGPRISISISLSGGCEPVSISAENLSRILVNLTRNAAEAMGGKGRILIAVERARTDETGWAAHQLSSGAQGMLRLTFADSGPGIPAAVLEAAFSPGYTTHHDSGAYNQSDGYKSPVNGIESVDGLDFPAETGQWPDPAESRGLGLSIVRSMVSSAGGTVRAVSRAGDSAVLTALAASQAPGAEHLTGAVFVLEFPILSTRTQPAQSETNVPWPPPAHAAWNGIHETHGANPAP